jgi:type IV secretion system protein VirB9
MKTLLLLSALSLCCSCASVDVEKNLRDAEGSGARRTEDGLPFSVRIDPEIVLVERERPVFIPEKEAARPAPSGVPAVQESNRAGIARPSDYSHAAMVYDYDPDWVYEVYAQPLRACDIVLEPGESVLEAPFVSDSVRWLLGAGISYQRGVPVQHIYVKPAEPGIEASLIINTDRRVYHVILRSFTSVHMPITRWNYFASAMPYSVLPPPGAPAGAPGGDAGARRQQGAIPSADPRFLSFNYKITYGWFSKPRWLPELVFDDGSKTFISFPESVLNRELPAVFENRKDVLNYRVIDNLVIIDQLVENITVKIGRVEISISKKGGPYGK